MIIIPRTKRLKTLSISLIMLFLTLALGACNLTVTPESEQVPQTSDQVEVTETLISFIVDVPSNTPSNEPVFISILDEVTGLALNAKRYPMKQVNKTQYSIELPFRIGSIVKYRYSRQGKILSEEHSFNGDPVRYRLCTVEVPAEIHDIVTRWSDTQVDGETGRVSGKITNATSEEPIPGILITVGGIQTYTTANGTFFVDGLPPGIHNLVAYAIDGSFKPFQQGAKIAPHSNTQVEIALKPTQFVDVAFLVDVPEDMIPAVPLRLAGNLFQLGNTFTDLAGGINSLATRMPVLSPLSDGRYGVILSLPSGSYIRYKYTLGDGFWNAEQQSDGQFAMRQLIVPESSTVVEDKIETFNSSEFGQITFDITVPKLTPESDDITIQFNPYAWTEPIPMWRISDQRWIFILTSPLQKVEKFGVRYCRQGQCGYADDLRTTGDFTSGKVVHPSQTPTIVQDKIKTWAWLEKTSDYPVSPKIKVNPRKDFVQGIEFQPRYQPNWGPIIPSSFEHIADLGANTVIVTPKWTFIEDDPPVLSFRNGNSAHWLELTATIQQAQSHNLNVAIKPITQFPTNPEDWWINAPRDFSWWVSWFDQYKSFVLHHARLAEMYGVNTLIIGGDWLNPALPNGELANDSNSGVPLDAADRWETLLHEIREVYTGTLAWELSTPDGIKNPPAFINQLDQIYLQFDGQLSSNKDANLESIENNLTSILEDEVLPFWLSWTPTSDGKNISSNTHTINNKAPLILEIAYPSADGGITGCLPDPIIDCIKPTSMNFPAPDYPRIPLDLTEQADAYNSILTISNHYSWIGGLVSQGYYPPASLLDKSTSIHGKPAETVLEYWFHRINP
ncbi:MAG TPA: carboxypeptidase-like regulatory domain-containing protein [Anaerolineae bacterium]|nr:carboxypeptidase-like regulatory domain-containing protein [Anaerolineae bacterium]